MTDWVVSRLFFCPKTTRKLSKKTAPKILPIHPKNRSSQIKVIYPNFEVLLLHYCYEKVKIMLSSFA